MLKVQESIAKVFASDQGLQTTLFKILKIIGTTFRWKAVIIWLPDENGILRYGTSWTDNDLKNTSFITLTKKELFRPGQPGPGKVLVAREAKEFENYYGPVSNPRKKAALKEDLTYVYLDPIVFDKELFGIIEFVRNKPPKNLAGLKASLEATRSQIGHYIKIKQADQKLELSEEKSKVLVELAPAIIYTLDSKGLITSLNPTVEKITGIKEENLIGKPMTELICTDDRERVDKLLEEARSEKEVALIEASIISQTDETIFAEIKEKEVTRKNGKVERIGIIRDVTDRYLLERQKDLWVGIATHELKTPLSSIKAFVQILQMKSKSDDLNLYLQRINDLSDDMTTLISDLLDITKIKSGTLQLVKDKFDLKELIINTVKSIQATTPSHRIKYDIKGNPKVYADKRRINQVLTNILTNAAKYSPQDTDILVKLNEIDGKVLLSVKDQGIGIDKKDLNQVFDLFFRSNRKSDRNVFGMGLGLFISKAIVRAHEGRIWAESELGKGSTFNVELPTRVYQSEK